MFKNIDAERARKSMSIADMCGAIGANRRTYYYWKKKGEIPASKLWKMADLFDCSIDYLIGREERSA